MTEESIFAELRKAGNLDEDDHDFDTELLIIVNGLFAKLNDLGAGPETVFVLEDDTSKWLDFSEDTKLLAFVKPWMKTNVRIQFDPPSNTALLDTLKQNSAENEWRIQFYIEGK